MSLRLPSLSIHSSGAHIEEIVERLSAAGDDAFAHAEGEEDAFLVVRDREAVDAARWDGARFAPIEIDEFFEIASRARSVEVCAIPSGVAVALPVLFRREPKTRLHSGWLEAKPLLLAVLARERKSVIVSVRRGATTTLVICPDGVPSGIHPGPGERIPDAPTPAERLAAFCVMNPDAVVEVWDDLPVDLPEAKPLSAIAPARGKASSRVQVEAEPELETVPSVERPREPALDAPVSTAPLSLVVKLADRVLFRWEVVGDRAFTIGRGGEADVHLDNLGISRKHARGRRIGDHILLEDLGSENGMLFRGQRVHSVVLSAGDEVGIGKYTIVVGKGGSLDELLAPVPSNAPAVVSPLETFAIPTASIPVAHLEHAGKSHRITGLAFTIGAAEDNHLRVTGFLIAPTHVRILRSPDGTHLVTHVAGARRLRVNGHVVKEAKLKDGDVLEIGGHKEKIVFRQPAALTPPRAALLHVP